MRYKRPSIIAVDFDGTLCTNKYPEIGEMISPVMMYILRSQQAGAKIILWTCRSGEELSKAIDWCNERGLIFDAINDNIQSIIDSFGINPRKIYADEYIDDRAINSHLLKNSWKVKEEMGD